jgi:energy-coupling factor transporter transmembrane protein EcfT
MDLLAYSYPLLNAFWTMCMIFLFILWIWVVIGVIADVFRSRDLSGIAKAVWLFFIVFLPVLGVLMYLIVRGDKMHTHAVKDIETTEAAMGVSSASQLKTLADLHASGALTDAEFASEKQRVLAT